jgi:hypothetical protein
MAWRRESQGAILPIWDGSQSLMASGVGTAAAVLPDTDLSLTRSAASDGMYSSCNFVQVSILRCRVLFRWSSFPS